MNKLKHFGVLMFFSLCLGCKTANEDFRLHYTTKAQVAELARQNNCAVLTRDSYGWRVVGKINVGEGEPMKNLLPDLRVGRNLGERPLTIVKCREKVHLDFFGPHYEEKRRIFEETLIVPGSLVIVGPMR